MFDTIKTKYRRNPVFHAVLLSGFALISAVLLIIGNQLTAESIELRRIEDLQFSLGQVIPADLHDNNLWSDTRTLKDADGTGTTYHLARRGGEVTAAAFEQTTAGYSGLIRLLIGVDREGKILGVRVLAHTETPGLGDKIDHAKNDWILGFDDKSLTDPTEAGWKVKKDGGVFDQFSGATITPRAVVKAIHQGLILFASQKDRLLAPGKEGTS